MTTIIHCQWHITVLVVTCSSQDEQLNYCQNRDSSYQRIGYGEGNASMIGSNVGMVTEVTCWVTRTQTHWNGHKPVHKYCNLSSRLLTNITCAMSSWRCTIIIPPCIHCNVWYTQHTVCTARYNDSKYCNQYRVWAANSVFSVQCSVCAVYSFSVQQVLWIQCPVYSCVQF